jgi:hypothetical protein
VNLAVGLFLIREKHHVELADDRFEGAIREWQGRGVGELPLDLLVGPKLCACHIKHRVI